ncbi:hypothetical protein [Sulfurimonas sp. C5]|uniref:hypothetical protein n=1 Tax=Sulfurimonas sp. C5 TaxID=3036947 RepID=UPI0024566058|nr:hypothetical protein [Sulfurimonas sp. C5]MDH4944855.1 hypothetical protein [Sulfurimonas sp. C5]
MIKLLLFLLPIALFSEKIYETTFTQENKKAMNNPKIKCRMVCDKKLYRQQEISEAISFYKSSKRYTFTQNGFSPFE